MAVHQTAARYPARTNTGAGQSPEPFGHWPFDVGRVERRHGLTFVYSPDPGGFRIGDYLKVPDEDTKVELWDGMLVVYPPADKRTRGLTKYFYELLEYMCEGELHPYIGPMDITISPTTVFAPDLLVLAPTGPPAVLVVEFRRDRTARAKLERWAKLEGYAKAGIKIYWAVDPDSLTLTVYEREGRGRNARWSQPEEEPDVTASGLPVRVAGVVPGEQLKIQDDPKLLRRVIERLRAL